jgi:hypothetical protein
MLLTDVTERLQDYERSGLHYHLAAVEIYAKRKKISDVLSSSFQPYIIAGLISYDMARNIGTDPYVVFAERLKKKLEELRPILAPLTLLSLATVNLDEHKKAIQLAFDTLSECGPNGLHVKHDSHFYVGATKILHWLNPELFLIIDSYIATAFHHNPNKDECIEIIRHGSPMYSSETYIKCLFLAQREIQEYGEESLRKDGYGLPLTNIYGNVAFQYGKEIIMKRDIKLR